MSEVNVTPLFRDTALPSVEEVEAVAKASGRLPYILAGLALEESVSLRASGRHTEQYGQSLRTALENLAKSAAEGELSPHLSDGLGELLTKSLEQLHLRDQRQTKLAGISSEVVRYGFYDYMTNNFDKSGMTSAELLLATIVDHGRQVEHQEDARF
ncbi:hypothetical protein KDA08_04900 [Candidatus Saccharibacteria bacterium]|nr:hypothetical protein [Candidatus Saccharibacteria bacterium]MCA9313619.1 hypothetical protein [Candidatus Saccharibacteria bacterium]